MENHLMTQNGIDEMLVLHGLWLESVNDGQKANLRKAYLCRANLRGADLRGANLQACSLCNAQLDGAIILYKKRKCKIRFEPLP